MPQHVRPAPCYLAPDDAPAKKKILTEALRLFVRDGLCETSVRDIAKATGYTNPALFKHFATKDRLALHLFEQCYANLFQAVERAIAGHHGYVAQQQAVIAAYLDMLDADRDALLYVTDNLRHFWPMLPAGARRSSIVGLVHALIERGRGEGLVTDAIPVDFLAMGWVGVMQQFARAWFFGGFAGPARRHAARLEQMLRADDGGETMTKVHALRTGSVRIKLSQMAGRGRGLARAGHILTDADWSGWVPIHAWLIEHDEGLILVDTGETARVHERGYHPRWHPFYRLASQFQVAPHDEIGPQLREMGVRSQDIRQVVITHLHTDHAGGLAHLVDRPTLLHPRELSRAKGIGGQVQGYLPHRWPKWWNPEPLRFESLSFGPFREAMPLTRRGDVFVVPTPGHTPGHVSVIVRGEPSIFIAGDTSYTEDLLKQGVVDGVSPDEAVARETNQRILALAREQPLVYLPSHDSQSADRLARMATLTPPEHVAERVA